MTTLAAGLVLASSLLLGGPATPPPPADPAGAAAPARADAELDRLVAMMTGSFSSAEQAAADKDNYLDIRLHMARIWPERTDGVWIYVEQAAAGRLDRPYRQRVYRVARAENAPAGDAGPHDLAPKSPAFVSEVFTLPGDAVRFAGAWQDASKLGSLTPGELTPRSGCAVWLSPEGDGFTGGTRGGGCASDLRGASFATSQAVITPTGLRTWDRGYDAGGKQVWGAEKGPYEFKRVRP